jgi:outer membrane lipoprotein-sorting protein
MSRRCSLLPILALALLASVPGSARPADLPTGALDVALLSDRAAAGAILERFDAAQKDARTLVAAFEEHKRVRLLVHELTQSGTFFYTAPDHFLWEYADTDGKLILLTPQELLVYYPGRKKAERVDISRYSKRILRFFGFGQTTAELRKYYELSVAEDGQMPDTYLLLMEPTKRRLRKRLSSIRLWIDRERMAPRQIEYVESDGDYARFTFRNLEINAPISAGKYDIRLPPDVQVSRSFSGILAID